MNKIKTLQLFLFSSNSEFIWQDEQLSNRIKKTILLGNLLELFALIMKVILFLTLFFIFKETLISIIKGDETLVNKYGVADTIKVIQFISKVIIPFTLFIFITIKLVLYKVQKQAFGTHYIRMIMNAICKIYILGPALLTASFITIEGISTSSLNYTLLILVTCIMISVLNKISNRISYLKMYARGIRHVGILSPTKLNPIINENSDGVKRSD